MNWQFSNDAPIYAQLIGQIRAGIVSGAFSPGERLPSVRDLAMEAGVNPNTMQRALTELERGRTGVQPADLRPLCNGGSDGHYGGPPCTGGGPGAVLSDRYGASGI